ncbi:MAG TPA: condensation domain-containing protein, partial [Chitinophagaceae bacterium]|nr:condensation domain-containing protein [Chitinophagaceae bacterium]
MNQAINLLYRAKESGLDLSLENDKIRIVFPKNKVIDAQLLEDIRNNKSLIRDFLANNKLRSALVEKDTDNSIGSSGTPGLAPLSFSQERFWFIHQLEGSVQYHMPAVFQLRGDIDKRALEYALRQIINRHQPLRTVIREVNGAAWQHILPADSWSLEFTYDPSFANDKDALKRYTDQLTERPFDLSNDYMLRAHLIASSFEDNTLAVVIHHIAFDGWSMSILVKELLEIYNSSLMGRPFTLPELTISYADYAAWQRRHLAGEWLEKKLDYWKQKLQGVEPMVLKADRARSADKNMRAANLHFTIDKEVTGKLKILSQQEGVTLFMTLLAAFKVLLYRYTGQHNICVGSAIAGRQRPESAPLIGCFINMLALRSELKND